MPERFSKSGNLYLHVDGDSFFVACEVSVRPELKGKPVIVGADRGIAVAMSTEAKKLGVTRGMPVFQIKRQFPQIVILNHNFKLYQDIADKLYQILTSYFMEVEVYSIDECFALVQPFEVRYYGGEKKLMQDLKNEIQKTLNVSYSLGLARTKALSKVASKLEKPGGLVLLLSREDEMRALKATPIDDIWGIGRRTVPRLRELGLSTAYDFALYSPTKISRYFSEPVTVLQKEFNGEQIMKVESNVDPRDQKSIQSTATFRPASTLAKVITREVSENAEHACEEARQLHLVSNKVSFFIKTSDFKYRVDEVKLEEYTADPGVVMNAIESKLAKLLLNKERIRSTGVMLHNLVRQEKAPHDLFGNQEKELKKLVVEEAADKIRKKFGHNAIKRAASLGKEPSNYNPGSSFKKGSR
jgi:DNA polymerase-4